jgi:hypothetical protein
VWIVRRDWQDWPQMPVRAPEDVSHEARRPAIQLVSFDSADPAYNIVKGPWIGGHAVSTSVAKVHLDSSNGALINRSTVDTVL